MTTVLPQIENGQITVAELLAKQNMVNEANWKQLKAEGLVWTGKNITAVERQIDIDFLEELIATHGAQNIVFGSVFNLAAGFPVDKWSMCGRSVLYWPATT